MEKPYWVTNEASWLKTRKKVVARAKDLLNNRMGVIVCAREMCKLAFWLRAEDDPHFQVFKGITSASDELPAGEERQHWSSKALEREDKKIARVEKLWRKAACDSASKLIAIYGVNKTPNK